MLKILVVGLGSMGKRRIRNLVKLGFTDIIGFDPRKDRRDETAKKYPIKVQSSLINSLKSKPEVMIISTPPDKHLKYIKIAIKNNIHFFTEVNLISKHVEEAIYLLRKKALFASPSNTMHFHPVIKELKKLLQKNVIGNPLIIHHHCGQFLPDWHPWENYHDFFVSKKQTGGAKEILYMELSWLTYLFSDIRSVFSNVEKISKLDTQIDDVYQSILKFMNNLRCTITIDVLSIPSFRETKIIGETGTIKCNFDKGEIKIFKKNKIKQISIKMGQVAKGYGGSTPPEKLYEEEMNAFLNSIKNKKKILFSFNDELKILKIINAIEKSSKIKHEVKLTRN